MLSNILICGICKKEMEYKDKYFPTSGYASNKENPLHVKYCGGNFHWDCFVNWNARDDFAKELSKIIVKGEDKSPLIAKIYVNNEFYIFVNLRTKKYKVIMISLLIGIVIEVELENWSHWIEKIQNIQGQDAFEIDTFKKLIPILIDHFPTKEDIESSVNWEKKKELREEIIKKQKEDDQKARDERLKTVSIYNSMVNAINNDTLRCPFCQGKSIRLLDRSPESESAFICRSCCRSFKIEDLK